MAEPNLSPSGTAPSTATPSTPPPQEITSAIILEAYRKVLAWVFLTTIVLIVLIAVALTLQTTPWVLTYVILAGALGAFFSALTRLYNFEDLPRALVGTGLGLRNFYLVIYSLIPPVVGAIAATALHVGFASGLIEGELFPKFVCHATDGKCDDFATFVKGFGPDGPKEYGKAIIWGFLAGFSERLVPDLFQKVAQSEKVQGDRPH